MRIRFAPLLMAMLMLLSACGSTSDAATVPEEPESTADSKSPNSHEPNVPEGYRLAEDGEKPDAYINEDGSIVTDPYNDDRSIGSDLWGVKSENAYDDDTGEETDPNLWNAKADSFYEEDWDSVPFYDMDYMSSERAQYRLETAQASPYFDLIGIDNGYDYVMRNIKTIHGTPGKADGSIEWVDRNGYATNFGINTINGIIACYVGTDLPVIKGDFITVYGDIGEGSYIHTNEYGVSTEISCPYIDVRDYYLNRDSVARAFGVIDRSVMQSGPVDLAEVLPESLVEAWFGNAVFYNREREGSVELTLDTINGFSYTIRHWNFDEVSGRLLLAVWLDDYIDNYYNPSETYSSTPVDRYTLLVFEDNSIFISTADERGGYRNITEGSNIVLSDEESRQLYFAHDLKTGYLEQ